MASIESRVALARFVGVGYNPAFNDELRSHAMPVNLPPVDPDSLYPVPGVRLGYAEAGIKKPGRKDVLLMEFVEVEILLILQLLVLGQEVPLFAR